MKKLEYKTSFTHQDIIDSFGYETLKFTEEGGYSGDSFAFLKLPDDKYAYLTFGWGSCTGCDALERCNSYNDNEELKKLQDELFNGLKIFEGKKATLDFFNNHDWKGEFNHSPELIEFAKNYFKDEQCEPKS